MNDDAARLRAQKRASTDPERLERMAQLAEKMETKMTTISKEDETQAREWLARAINTWRPGGGDCRYSKEDDVRYRNIIRALLDRPVMPHPDDVPDGVLHDIWQASLPTYGGTVSERGHRIYTAAYDALTKREPVKVEAWAVFWDDAYISTYSTRADAQRNAAGNPRARIVHLVEADHD